MSDLLEKLDQISNFGTYLSDYVQELCGDASERITELEAKLAACGWQDIGTAPKDGKDIVGWFEPNEVHAPHKSRPWVTRWEIKQFKDGLGKEVGQPFGMWVTDGWRDKMSYAPTKWHPTPPSEVSDGKI